MADGLFVQLSSQAWSQYKSVTSRDDSYLKLLDPKYQTFLSVAGKVDATMAKLTTPPKSDQISPVADAVTLLESAQSGITQMIEKFVQMDADAVKSAGTINQKSISDKNAQEQSTDQDFQIAIDGVVYQAQVRLSAASAEV
ncbi:MAG: hypothetical protein RIG26_04010 [Thalassospira sp.]|uniref:hypothetical protein n=1 Tax=Thalassospira TaxID=168934 RepID=UPI0032EAAFE2|tara:strand:+ start:182 stop:604 length:423 start_codon:yes stop_codon:yes gene_type:complete